MSSTLMAIAGCSWTGRKIGPQSSSPATAHLLSADIGRIKRRASSGTSGRVRGPREGHGDRPSRGPGDDDPLRPLPWGRSPPLAGPGELRPTGDRRGHPQGQGHPLRELRAPPGRPPGHLAGSQNRGRHELPPTPKRGDEIHGAFSLDGDHWTPFPPMVTEFEDRLEIGVVAVSSSSKPMTAELRRVSGHRRRRCRSP